MHPNRGIKQILSDPYIWWSDYFDELIDSKLWDFDTREAFSCYDEGDNSSSTIIAAHEFKDIADTIKVFEKNLFPSLSARSLYPFSNTILNPALL